jgi:hypothetical protein
MNKFLKTMAAHRNEEAAETGLQWWIYHGPVKASGSSFSKTSVVTPVPSG